jgi:hypothetical protein
MWPTVAPFSTLCYFLLGKAARNAPPRPLPTQWPCPSASCHLPHAAGPRGHRRSSPRQRPTPLVSHTTILLAWRPALTILVLAPLSALHLGHRQSRAGRATARMATARSPHRVGVRSTGWRGLAGPLCYWARTTMPGLGLKYQPSNVQ